jgi:hypothetical protein
MTRFISKKIILTPTIKKIFITENKILKYNIIMLNKKYIILNNYKGGNGLNDMKDRFTEFIKLSIILNLIPILPEIHLADFHTKKKNNLLTDYIEIPDFVSKEIPLEKEQIFFWNLTSRFILYDKLFIEYKEQIMNLKFNINYLEKYKKIAKKINEDLIKIQKSGYSNSFFKPI